jgi:hypothetical protein
MRRQSCHGGNAYSTVDLDSGVINEVKDAPAPTPNIVENAALPLIMSVLRVKNTSGKQVSEQKQAWPSGRFRGPSVGVAAARTRDTHSSIEV